MSPSADVWGVCRWTQVMSNTKLLATHGAATSTHTIFIDGAALGITQNLHSALLRLRTERPRKLWVDAICMNQDDAGERTQQVAFMRHIFPFAKRTIIWLGEPQSDDDPAFVFSFIERVRLLQPVLLQSKFDYETRWLDCRKAILELQATKGILVHDNGTLRGEYRHIGPEDAQVKLTKFFGLAWFSRRWVLQEVLLSNIGTLTWGAHTLPWSKFMFAVKWCDWRQLAPHAAKFNTATITNARRPDVQRTRPNILQLMIDFKDFEYRDPRDKITALQGLWNNLTDQEVIRYADSVETNYARFAEVMAHSGSLEQLLQIRVMNPAARNIQLENGLSLSWIPDWCIHPGPHATRLCYTSTFGECRAHVSDDYTVSFDCWVVDTVLSVRLKPDYWWVLETRTGHSRRVPLVPNDDGEEDDAQIDQPDVFPGDRLCVLTKTKPSSLQQFVIRPFENKHYQLVAACSWDYAPHIPEDFWEKTRKKERITLA